MFIELMITLRLGPPPQGGLSGLPEAYARGAGRPHGAAFARPRGVFFLRSTILRGFVAAQAGQRCQCLVRGFFLVQGLLKEIRGFVITELVSPFGQATIGSRRNRCGGGQKSPRAPAIRPPASRQTRAPLLVTAAPVLSPTTPL